MKAPVEMKLVPGASHLFEEPGTLAEASGWPGTGLTNSHPRRPRLIAFRIGADWMTVVLAPVDGSIRALRAVPWAAKLAGPDGTVVLLRVVPPQPAYAETLLAGRRRGYRPGDSGCLDPDGQGGHG